MNQKRIGNRKKLFSVEKSTKFWSKLDPNEAFLSENDFFFDRNRTSAPKLSWFWSKTTIFEISTVFQLKPHKNSESAKFIKNVIFESKSERKSIKDIFRWKTMEFRSKMISNLIHDFYPLNFDRKRSNFNVPELFLKRFWQKQQYFIKIVNCWRISQMFSSRISCEISRISHLVTLEW